MYLPSVYDATVFASENLFAPLLALTALLMFRHLRTGSPLAMVRGAFTGMGHPNAPLCDSPSANFWGDSRVSQVEGAGPLLADLLAGPLGFCRRRSVDHPQLPSLPSRRLGCHQRRVDIYGGNNDIVLTEPNYYGGWIRTGQLPERQLVDAAPDEVSHDKVEWDLGLKWVRTHAAWVPLLCTMKFVRFCLPEINSGNQKYVLLQILATDRFSCWSFSV